MRIPRFGVLVGALVAGALLTGACVLAYLVMQQIERQGANDPQVQIAEDGATALAHGTTPREVAPGSTVDLATSLATAVIVLDDAGRVVASNATLGGATPVPAAGVLAGVRSRREERVTWAPRPEVRLASVVRRVDGAFPGFIVVARSLREVEARIARIGDLIFAIWIAGAVAIALVSVALIAAAPRQSMPRVAPAPA